MNGQSKIGQRELEIIAYLEYVKEARSSQLIQDFVSRPSHYNEVKSRLKRMKEKGFISIEEGVVRLAV